MKRNEEIGLFTKPSSLIERLEKSWEVLAKRGIDTGLLVEKGLLSAATCCLVNPDREKTVEKAFEAIKLISGELREKYLGYKWRCNK